MMSDRTYVPPEWATHAAVWVGWPHIRGEWGTAFEGARTEITGFIRELCQQTPVHIACGSKEAYKSAWMALDSDIAAERVSLHTLPSGDIWLRDTGPMIARDRDDLVALKFQFNGWGGKYVMPGDTMTASAIASAGRLRLRTHDFVLEGGAVDLDGAGLLLSTRQCVLNANRNADWSEPLAEAALKSAFGIEQVIWLSDGLKNDHTDGHVDNIARFVGPGRVVCQRPSGADDPNSETLLAVERDLRAAGLDVVTVPSPGRVLDEAGDVVPASHMNFLISNQHVYVPVYETEYAPRAIAELDHLMGDFTIVPLPARHILCGGGAFHCMTQQVPLIEEPTK